MHPCHAETGLRIYVVIKKEALCDRCTLEAFFWYQWYFILIPESELITESFYFWTYLKKFLQEDIDIVHFLKAHGIDFKKS